MPDIDKCCGCMYYYENRSGCILGYCTYETEINDTSMIPEKDLSLSFIERAKELEKEEFETQSQNGKYGFEFEEWLRKRRNET